MASAADSFQQLFALHRRSLARAVYSRVNDRELAEDIAAETFRIAWEKQMNGTTITAGWLFTTARNLIGDEYRRRARLRDRHERLVTEATSDVATWSDNERDLELHDAIARLAPAEALILQLTYWDGLNAREAAAFLECSVAALWMRLSRARAALRRQLESPNFAATEDATGGEVRG